MNDKIIDFFKKEPPVYEKSSKAFWDDEHISKGMLEAHLDAAFDGASRKLPTIQKSVAWICNYCQDVENKQLLDLGCGPGIYSELLYDQGFSVTGIDFSRRSIAYAQNHAEETKRKIEYHYQNYLEMDYQNKFDLVILIYCDFGVLPPQDRAVLLKKIHKALKRGGILILDVYHEPYRNAFHEMQSIQYEDGGFWSPEPYVVIQKNKVYTRTNNTLEQYLVITKESMECFYIWNQIYSKVSFMEEIEKQGFETVDMFDDICGRPFTGQKESICGVFTKPVGKGNYIQLFPAFPVFA